MSIAATRSSRIYGLESSNPKFRAVFVRFEARSTGVDRGRFKVDRGQDSVKAGSDSWHHVPLVLSPPHKAAKVAVSDAPTTWKKMFG